MNASRLKTSDINRAYVKALKKFGMTMPHAENKYSASNFSKEFSNLTEKQKRIVWRNIITSSMRTRGEVDTMGRVLSKAGTTLYLIAYACVIYKILKSKNKISEAEKQSVMLTGSYVGSRIGGAIAEGEILTTTISGSEIGAEIGIFGGPADLISVPLGVFLGGAIGGMVGVISQIF